MAELLVDGDSLVPGPARSDRGLFRWAGGKSHLIDRLVPIARAHLAQSGGRLISCFYGSGAIERAVGGEQIGADTCPELLALFEDLQSDGAEAVHHQLVRFASSQEYTKSNYERLREVTNLPPLQRSARFLWLSAMAFNGVWRVNSRGKMNMPCDPARLARGPEAMPPLAAAQSFAQQIARTIFVKGGWRVAWLNRTPADLIFADPPYMGKNAFRAYTKEGFDDTTQRYLAIHLREHVDQGGAIIAFNSPVARHLYERWSRCEDSMRAGTVSSDIDARDEVAELIITAGLRGAP